MTIYETLLARKDDAMAAFQAKLTPTLPPDCFLGIKVPELREIEKQYRGTEEYAAFLGTLPHRWFDENMLHGIMISKIKSYDGVLAALDAFLPYVDNWAVCDVLKPEIFKKEKTGLLEKIKEWIASPAPFTCRFGIEMLMTYYLDEDYRPEYLALPAAVHREEYYVNMMIAWYYATALAKHWDDTVRYLENNCLDKWVHTKTIQKAKESYRITKEQKEYLSTLKRGK